MKLVFPLLKGFHDDDDEHNYVGDFSPSSGSSVFLLLINFVRCEQLGCEYLLIAGCYKGARVC